MPGPFGPYMTPSFPALNLQSVTPLGLCVSGLCLVSDESFVSPSMADLTYLWRIYSPFAPSHDESFESFLSHFLFPGVESFESFSSRFFATT